MQCLRAGRQREIQSSRQHAITPQAGWHRSSRSSKQPRLYAPHLADGPADDGLQHGATVVVQQVHLVDDHQAHLHGTTCEQHQHQHGAAAPETAFGPCQDSA